mmetsp:Transcript_15081/g.33254  ORF Transcript_15081/g.33254 Transcript_15081/m.33254 type:complete len:200 (+) Transcript_15081:4424-5023(+)
MLVFTLTQEQEPCSEQCVHVLLGAVHTSVGPHTSQPLQSPSDAHVGAWVALGVAEVTQRTFPGPSSPMYPPRHSPQVFSTLAQLLRCREAQSGAAPQSTAFSAALPTEMALLVASLEPAPEASCFLMEVSICAALAADTMARSDAPAEACRASKTSTLQTTALRAEAGPAGRVEAAEAPSERPCTTMALPEEGSANPNW